MGSTSPSVISAANTLCVKPPQGKHVRTMRSVCPVGGVPAGMPDRRSINGFVLAFSA